MDNIRTMTSQEIGKYTLMAGAVLMVAGLIIYYWGDRLSWIGRLPGDIYIERERGTFYFPVTTMILLSIVLSLALKLLRMFK